jgi:hypothetical protein
MLRQSLGLKESSGSDDGNDEEEIHQEEKSDKGL